MAKSYGFAAAVFATLGIAAAAQAASPTSSFTVTGAIATPGTYTQGSLAALSQVTEFESYTSAGNPVTDSFTGPTLWSVLTAAGGITTNPAVKNSVLTSYIIAAGSDGYQSVISAGEIDPKFGNRPDLVAIADSANQLPSPNGFARIVAAGDVAGGRYVSNLANLTIGVAPTVGGSGGGTTTQFSVGGGVANDLTVNAATLAALPTHTETVTYTSGNSSVIDTYTGVYLWDLLNSAGIDTDSTIKNDVLRKLVSVTGSDGYQVDFSLGELDPAFGDDQVLVATSDIDGQFAAGQDGFARLVVPGDLAGGRYVSNIASLSVFDPTTVPEPASMAMLLAGLVGIGMVKRSRR